MNYYFLKDESIHGPLQIEGLVELITKDTLVRDEKGEWRKASEIPELKLRLEELNQVSKIPPPLNKRSKETENVIPPPIKKMNKNKLTETQSNEILPPKLPSKTKKETISTPPKINKIESKDKLPKPNRKTTRTSDYSSTEGFSFSWLFGLAGIVGLIALGAMIFNSNSSSESRSYKPLPSNHENSYKEAKKTQEETNESYENTTEDASVEEKLKDDFANGVIFGFERKCKYCGNSFNSKRGFNDEGKSPALNGSEWCPSGQTVFCSRKCYNEW